ncbi:MAG: ATP-dependent zinc metalloprotease FtsH [Aggregatilineales bacterium]
MPIPIPDSNNAKLAALVGLIVVAGVLLFVILPALANNHDSIALSDVAKQVQLGNVKTVIVHNDTDLTVIFNDNTVVNSTKEQSTTIAETLTQLGVDPARIKAINYEVDSSNNLSQFLSFAVFTLLPILVIGWFLWRMMRTMRTGQDQALSFGRSKARVTRDMERPLVTFGDVAGADEAKQDLREIVEFLKEPEKFIQLGARIPKGVLLVGPPGTGKTLLAKAVAGEAGVPFFSISGSEFVEMFVGVGASRVRDLFERAKAESPAIIFVDEIDAVGRQRGTGLGGGHDEREQTLNQILVEMDGFDSSTNVIIMAATNRPDVLDPALLRPGRFDRKVYMDRPDRVGRRAILDIHSRGKPLASDVDLDTLAKLTPGFVGADLENMVNEAAILAARRGKKAISMRDFQESMERVVAGPERRSRIITLEERRVIAFHEAGHAIVMHNLTHADPVHKITIVARGQAGGYTMSLPADDRTLMTQAQFEDEIAALLGGRVAEEMTFNSVTNGASNDLQRATAIARTMITRYGMSPEMGLRTFGDAEGGAIFLGRDLLERRDYSEEAASSIDHEVRRIIDRAYQRTREILQVQMGKLKQLADTLLEQETVDRETFVALMNSPLPESVGAPAAA